MQEPAYQRATDGGPAQMLQRSAERDFTEGASGARTAASYDRRGPARPRGRGNWSFWIAVAVASAVVTLVLARLVMQYGPAEARAVVLGYRVLDQTSVRVHVAVTRDAQRDAVCLVRARDAAGSEVGHDEVLVPAEPAGSRRIKFSHVLRTTGIAVTGEVGRCLALAPGAPPQFDEPTVLPQP